MHTYTLAFIQAFDLLQENILRKIHVILTFVLTYYILFKVYATHFRFSNDFLSSFQSSGFACEWVLSSTRVIRLFTIRTQLV